MAPLASAQARADRKQIAPLYHFASRCSTALVVPLAGLLAFAGADILSIYRPEARQALPLLYILLTARAAEAIVGPATPIVEMTGHRVLPLLTSVIGLFVWILLSVILVPRYEAAGMAIAVGLATLAIAYAATLELQLSEQLTPFDRKLFLGLGVALAGVGLMWAVESVTHGPVRFVSVSLVWAVSSWCALRFGLTRSDRWALAPLSTKLRLV
jgi:O-antigen/teichoic acid export membrane protein